MGTHNLCLYKEVDKNYTGCNLKTTELLDCALIAACVVIRSNMVFSLSIAPNKGVIHVVFFLFLHRNLYYGNMLEQSH